MKEQSHSTPGVCPETSENGQTVTIYVDANHPLLQLKGALPREALFEVMTRYWREAGKNVEGRPGLLWDVSLYVPLLVLMRVKQLKPREMEAYLAENVVAQLVVLTGPMVERFGQSCDRLTRNATATLGTMHEVIKRLMPQIVQWITTGVVAKGKILHAGITRARSIVRNKAGKKVEFGLPYLLSRLGGGYVFGTMIQGVLDETRMPLEALRGYRAIFGPEATPELMVYDRGGGVKSTMDQLAKEGIQQVGVQPKGKEPWRVAEAVREVVRSERGKTEGIIGTLQSDKYNFNKPKERLWKTLEMSGPRSILSFNLNKLMRDVVQAGK